MPSKISHNSLENAFCIGSIDTGSEKGKADSVKWTAFCEALDKLIDLASNNNSEEAEAMASSLENILKYFQGRKQKLLNEYFDKEAKDLTTVLKKIQSRTDYKESTSEVPNKEMESTKSAEEAEASDEAHGTDGIKGNGVTHATEATEEMMQIEKNHIPNIIQETVIELKTLEQRFNDLSSKVHFGDEGTILLAGDLIEKLSLKYKQVSENYMNGVWRLKETIGICNNAILDPSFNSANVKPCENYESLSNLADKTYCMMQLFQELYEKVLKCKYGMYTIRHKLWSKSATVVEKTVSAIKTSTPVHVFPNGNATLNDDSSSSWEEITSPPSVVSHIMDVTVSATTIVKDDVSEHDLLSAILDQLIDLKNKDVKTFLELIPAIISDLCGKYSKSLRQVAAHKVLIQKILESCLSNVKNKKNLLLLAKFLPPETVSGNSISVTGLYLSGKISNENVEKCMEEFGNIFSQNELDEIVGYANNLQETIAQYSAKNWIEDTTLKQHSSKISVADIELPSGRQTVFDGVNLILKDLEQIKNNAVQQTADAMTQHNNLRKKYSELDAKHMKRGKELERGVMALRERMTHIFRLSESIINSRERAVSESNRMAIYVEGLINMVLYQQKTWLSNTSLAEFFENKEYISIQRKSLLQEAKKYYNPQIGCCRCPSDIEVASDVEIFGRFNFDACCRCNTGFDNDLLNQKNHTINSPKILVRSTNMVKTWCIKVPVYVKTTKKATAKTNITITAPPTAKGAFEWAKHQKDGFVLAMVELDIDCKGRGKIKGEEYESHYKHPTHRRVVCTQSLQKYFADSENNSGKQGQYWRAVKSEVKQLMLMSENARYELVGMEDDVQKPEVKLSKLNSPIEVLNEFANEIDEKIKEWAVDRQSKWNFTEGSFNVDQDTNSAPLVDPLTIQPAYQPSSFSEDDIPISNYNYHQYIEGAV
ncbi:hypothetical protein BCR33DRAFT_852620 [Rhizoclosmatium globosum]|uniref:Uncharacterized protein n=1 Tax=Rhizoclosmatium globosum TaxID=329046 RepID=A0A1Y2C1F9_9FUNG|nr:hypothetical protein BCR33DRAFT_852620 [Rhizoclosmatium globosum]|eukprot:ORY40734.1 hypothetical protein BCR33DRAFT_852620 [Rhizoclosmatium globosum]